MRPFRHFYLRNDNLHPDILINLHSISGGVVFFAKIKKYIYPNELLLEKFLKFLRAAFLTLSGDCFRGTKNLQEAAVRRSSLK